jgi:hypothetical protein
MPSSRCKASRWPAPLKPLRWEELSKKRVWTEFNAVVGRVARFDSPAEQHPM